MPDYRAALRSFAPIAGILALTACAAASSAQGVSDSAAPAAPAIVEPTQEGAPNVLFIMVDDLRLDVGAYGSPVAQTPNIDALADSGILFERAFVSQAVCGPSRAALLTGLRPSTSGITDLQTPVDEALPDVTTMLDMFKGAGYETLGYGKVYHHEEDDADGWSIREEDQEKIQRRAARRAGLPRLAADRSNDRAGLPDTINVESAIAQMPRFAGSEEPFFMAVGIHRPHLPFVAPTEFWDMYREEDIPAPVFPDGQLNVPDWAIVAYEIWNYDDTKEFQSPGGGGEFPADKQRQLRWGYLASVSYADSLVGDLLSALEANGLDDNTIVVLWSDHGWKFDDLNGWAKHSTANVDIQVPLIVRAPGQTQAGTRSPRIVETVDIYPTLAELAGLQAPANLEGTSFTPLFTQPERDWKLAAFSQYGRNARGFGPSTGETVRTDRFRYTAWTLDKDGTVIAQELYDLQNDPDEGVNVAGESEYATALEQLEFIRQNGWEFVRDGIEG